MWEYSQISWETKRHPLKSSHIYGDWQTDKATPPGPTERKNWASTPHVVTTQTSRNQGLQSSYSQMPHTGSVWDISGHVTPGQVHTDWVLGKAAWSLPLSVLISSQSGALTPLRWLFWGLRPPPTLAEHLLLSNMPTHSPQRHNRPLIHTPSSPPPSLSPPARWDQTHARCLINTKMCQRCPVSCKESWETTNYHTDLWWSQIVQGGTRQPINRTDPTKL